MPRASSECVRPRLHTVCNDEDTTMGLLLRQLAERGYRRIGLAMRAQFDEHVGHLWQAGFLVHHAKAPPAERVAPFMPEDYLDRWIARSQIAESV